ncbi:LCP family protein [Blastococcus mobilis]|uniref:Transcriptional attenuator, LytR family n=1 Tax=Blastococcus mobilis TaxID=1938746 RepID=A0A238YSY5_9ACTN|nr:LCP family protein [Blastococcus mobilis]SNR73703.1 transcriptional attenuator, LytR family [Blastococcus mobilis]
MLRQTALGAILPGTALISVGARRVGWAVLGLAAAGALGLVLLATVGQRKVVQFAVDPRALLLVIAVAVAVAIGWSLVIIAGYRMLAPLETTRGQHVVGTVVVTLLALGVAYPAFEVARLASVQRNLIQNVFADAESATVPDSPAANPFAGKDRVNVLLLGGDGGAGRDGVRTDTVMVASIATATGATTLFSLPRNLEELPFPEDSPLSEVYPDGFDAGSESESLLNAVYRNGPADHPDILGRTDNPGADFLKLGVGEALGLNIDYYVLVNLDGFSRLVDALGGVTLNVNYWVPIGGEPTIGILPDDYIAPGPNQHMNGTRALDFARGRFGLSDYMRMDRQRCVINAIVAAADPMTLLTQYQELAATTQDIVRTDVPQAVLDDFVELAFRVKESGINSVVFDDTVIRPAYPDYDLIRSTVQTALGTAVTPTPPADDTSQSTGTAAPASSAPAPAAGGSGAEETPVDNVTDACAYDPVAAQKALDEGEPRTRRR